jgi:hypothetical protein
MPLLQLDADIPVILLAAQHTIITILPMIMGPASAG